MRDLFDTISLEELATTDRFALERQCRGQTQAVYLADRAKTRPERIPLPRWPR
jgi:hypothetical protein